MLVFDRVRSSTRFTITAQASEGPPSLPGNAPGTGQAWTDRNCLLMSKSAMLWNVGKQDAAIALLCRDADMRRALEDSGTACPAAR